MDEEQYILLRDEAGDHRASDTLLYLTQPTNWHQTLRDTTPEKENSRYVYTILSAKDLLRNMVQSSIKVNLSAGFLVV